MSHIAYLRSTKNIYLKSLRSDKILLQEKDALIDDLIGCDAELSFEIYSFMLRNPEFIDYRQIAQKSGLPQEVVEYILNTKPVKVYFPAVSNEAAEIVTAYVIKLPVETPKNSFYNPEGLSDIKAYIKHLQNKDFEDFFVFFDKNFSGQSYQLAVVMGLVAQQKVLEKYAFTGMINIHGNILRVNHTDKKKEISKQKGLRLIGAENFKTVDEALKFLNTKNMDVPFLILNKSVEEIEKSIQELSEVINPKIFDYLKVYDIELQDLYVQTINLPPEEPVWRQKLKELSEKLNKLYLHTDKQITLHIANGIATFGFLAGCILGSKHPFVLYHFLPAENRYVPVINLAGENYRNNKKIKKDILQNSKFIDIEINLEKPSSVANLIIYTASHNPLADVKNFTGNDKYVYIKDKNFQGKIPTDFDWSEYVSEIYSAMNVIKEEYSISKFNLFLSVPSAMAMGLGMAVGHFMDIDVYNYFKELDQKYVLVGNPKNLEPAI